MAEKKCADVVTLEGEIYVRKNSSVYPKVSKVANAKKATQNHPYIIGQFYFVQTATLYYCGTLSQVTDNELVLDEASWVADTGRFNEFMKGSKPKELEPCCVPVIIGRGAIISAMPRQLIVSEVI